MFSLSFKTRVAVTFFIITASLAAYSFFLLYHHSVKEETEQIRKNLKETAALGAAFIRAEEIQAVPLKKESERSEPFQNLVNRLTLIKNINPHIFDVYVMIPTDQPDKVLFAANADRVKTPVKCGEAYDISQIPALMQGLKRPDADKEIISDKWGEWLSGYAPIFDSSGKMAAILGIDMSAETVDKLKNVFSRRYLIVLAGVLLLAFPMGHISSYWLTKPIKTILKGMEKISAGDLNYQLPIPSQEEFKKISTLFNKMTGDLKQYMVRLEKTVGEKERMNRELEIAAHLQENALPEKAPDMGELEIASLSIPARQVGGDYFDFVRPDKEKIGFAIADAAGKGFPGALFMTKSRSVFRVISSEESLPAAILARTNQYIASDNRTENGIFITFFYGVYDTVSKLFTYSNAGHNPPLLFKHKAETANLLSAQSIPLGIREQEEFPQESTQLAKGDVLLLYTDGVTEAFNETGEMFGMERLSATVKNTLEETAAVIISKIETAVRTFIGTKPLGDDMTLVVLKVK